MATTPPRRLALSWLAVTALVACSGDAAASPTRIPDSDEVHRLVFAELGVFDNGAMLQDLKLVRGAGNNYAGSGTVPRFSKVTLSGSEPVTGVQLVGSLTGASIEIRRPPE